jgi:hypothetical protein
MPMMDVGVMWVPVDHRRVPMDMDVRFARRMAGSVSVLVVLVVDVSVLMGHRLVGMLMLVVLDEVQVETRPAPIRAAATSSWKVIGSPKMTTDRAAPMNGATEK